MGSDLFSHYLVTLIEYWYIFSGHLAIKYFLIHVLVFYFVLSHDKQKSESEFAFYRYFYRHTAKPSSCMKREAQQDATIRCLLLTSVPTCFGHHHAHLQENKGPVTAFGVLFWCCWMWLVAVVGRCLVGCEHYEGFCSTCFGHHYAHLQENKGPVDRKSVV